MKKLFWPEMMLSALAIIVTIGAWAYAQHSVTINWQQPAQPAGETVSSVQVVRDGSIITNPPLPPTSLTYTDAAVTSGTHAYAVANVDAKGNSGTSSPVSVTVPSNTPKPTWVCTVKN